MRKRPSRTISGSVNGVSVMQTHSASPVPTMYELERVRYTRIMAQIDSGKTRTSAEFFYAIEAIIERLGAKPVALQLPIGAEDKFMGHIDLVTMKAITYVDPLGQKWEEGDVPDELKEQAEHYRHELIEAVADH